MVEVLAHRGASRAAPENTVEAFRLAKAMGSDAVELDVRRTSDGVLVVHHDARLADGRAIITVAAAEMPVEVPQLHAAL
ncbi:MAG: glycerophosphodiester phosphodiesterase, partial [Ilumatobacteraceae bacterium]